MSQELIPQAWLPEWPLAAAKLMLPQPYAGPIARPRLYDRLDAGMQCKLTLILAPAGFGKTMLLSDWVARRHRPAAWLSLDRADHDPRQFWAYVLVALQGVCPQLGARAAAILRGPQPSIEAAAASLATDALALTDDVAIILDDYHTIGTPAIHAALARLLDLLPPRLHLYLSSRTEPPLPIARLRAHGQLAELRPADLRFTAGEAATLITSTLAGGLPEPILADLDAKFGGWAAGLRLALRAAHEQADPAQALAQVSGGHRNLADYLSQEILLQLPGRLRVFMLYTSMLGELSAPLCDAVLGRTYSQQLLEVLERRLLLVPLDSERRVFRYHELLAAFLLDQLKRRAPDQLPGLHARASAWYESQGLSIPAVEHALAAGDRVRAATLIDPIVHSMFLRGEAARLQRWMSILPDALITGGPYLCMLRAWELMQAQQPAPAAAWLEVAANALSQAARRASNEEDYAQLAKCRTLLAAARAAIAPVPDARLVVPAQSALVEPLTDRELMVLRCLAAGYSNSEVASELAVAVSTVRTHIKNIYGKLGVRNRVEAITYAQTLQLLRPGGG